MFGIARSLRAAGSAAAADTRGMSKNAARTQTAASSLGHLVAEHPIGAAGPALLVLGVGLLVCTAWMGYERQTMPWAGDAGTALMAQLFVVAMCITTALGLFLLLRWRRGRGAYVNVHEGGIHHAFAGKSWTLPWDELDYITVERRQLRVNAGAMPKRTYIAVITKSGARLKFNNYQRPDALGDAISLRLAEHLSPGTLADLRAGKTLDFGAFKVSSKGLQAARLSIGNWHLFAGRRFMGWQKLGSFKFDNGCLLLLDRSGKTWARVLHFHVKNIVLLLDLMQSIQERRAPQA
jgi:hypothetical protein